MRKVLVLVVTACLVALCGFALASCGSSSSSSSKPLPPISSVSPENTAPVVLQTVPVPPLPAGALLQVVRQDGGAKAFTMAELKAMPSTDVTVGTKKYSGPRLTDVLTASAVSGYTELLISGGSGRLSLLKNRVTANTIFAFTGANRVTLLSPTIDNSQWMIGANLVQAL